MRAPLITAVALTLAVPLSGAAAGRYSWFDSATTRDPLGIARLPEAPRLESRVRFGTDGYQALVPNRLLADDMDGFVPESDWARIEANRIQFFGEVTNAHAALYAPLVTLDRGGDNPSIDSMGRLTGFGIKWRHRLDSVNSIGVSYGYSEFAATRAPSGSESTTGGPANSQVSGAAGATALAAPSATQEYDIADTRAALLWSSQWAGGFRPGIGGSVFIGDEGVRDEAYEHLGRKYYGFTFGGEITLFRQHTPYLSYRLQRYSSEDPLLYPSGYEDQSSVSAGWKWQVQPNWSVQAEASYGLNSDDAKRVLDLYPPDRNRLFFGTRFDFR